jgi:hypothetical protein
MSHRKGTTGKFAEMFPIDQESFSDEQLKVKAKVLNGISTISLKAKIFSRRLLMIDIKIFIHMGSHLIIVWSSIFLIIVHCNSLLGAQLIL